MTVVFRLIRSIRFLQRYGGCINHPFVNLRECAPQIGSAGLANLVWDGMMGGQKIRSSYTKKQAVSVGEWVFLDFLSGMWKGSYKVKKNTTVEVIYLKPFPHCSSCPWNGAFNGFEIVKILEQVLKSQAKHLWESGNHALQPASSSSVMVWWGEIPQPKGSSHATISGDSATAMAILARSQG